MKKLIFCINSLEMGGAEKVLVQLVEEISKSKKYELKVITNIKTDNFLVDRIKKVAIYEYLLGKEESKKNRIKYFFCSIKRKLKFKKYIDKNSIVIDFLDGDFYKYTKTLKNRKIIWLHSSYESLKIRKKGILSKLKNSDKIITICNEMKEEILKINNNDIKKKLDCIYNPFNFNKIKKLSEEKFLKEELKYLRDNNFYVSVCRLNENEKDITSLIDAYKDYKGKNKLYIIGDGPDKEKLQNLVINKNLEDRIKFLGMKKNPYNWMKRSKGLILSSKFEGLPTVLIESLILKNRTASSNCKTGPKEILNNGEFGLLFSIGNKKEILRVLNELDKIELDNKKLDNFLERFKAENIIKEIEKLI